MSDDSDSGRLPAMAAGNGFDPARRRCLGVLGALPVVGALAPPVAAGAAGRGAATAGGLDGARGQFEIDGTHLNGAYTHPLSRTTAQALRDYLDGRLLNAASRAPGRPSEPPPNPALFARLIHADEDEIALVPSTMVGENHVVSGLGLPGSRQRVVTDAYHFEGSLYMYQELARQGLDVEIVRPRDNRIRLEDLDRAITPGTRLVAITLVSSINGFQHDLKAVCDLAHSRGALVYADIIQAAGTTPIDIHASGVDFAACATYKWLMGDFGMGFFYARRDRQPQLRRSQWGYRQMAGHTTHFLPFDPPGANVQDSVVREDLPGRIEVGTMSNAARAALGPSLQYLLALTPERIEAWRQPLLRRLHEALPRLGYQPMTPPDSRSALVSFAGENVGARIAPRLAAAGVAISVYRNHFRVSPSFYNTLDDVERLIEALS